ncbi:unnamed protein product [Microthlaspi erraticum]|uniref:F-box domain-containing protein n=1 Tax=Microthlaspi erraticum TaxID=1685480 RepID=A0A6D2J9F7_9BRAS|nr:unnamed protein product [Microthlaspi erraticum]
MEWSLPHDVVELIMERLPVNPLLRYKAVSKQWQTTIESPFFKERQLKHRQQTGDPDVLMACRHPYGIKNQDTEPLRTLVLGSSSSVEIPIPWEQENTLLFLNYKSSCDGLVCFNCVRKPAFVINPTTRWHRTLPLCKLQQLVADLDDTVDKFEFSFYNVGFGKDKFTGTYKLVWLYSSGLEQDANTICEVFDFSTNAWSYVTPAPPYGVIDPVYADGSLHWFVEREETKLVSFDLHTEAFQVVSKAPFAINLHPYDIVMCNLDNRLCVSEMKWPNQVIWSFNSGDKTWNKMCSIDFDLVSPLFNIPHDKVSILPLALLGKEKKKLLFCLRDFGQTLLIHDLVTKSYEAAFLADFIVYPVCYFPSLISI